MYRYLALVWNPQHLDNVRSAAALVGAAPAAWSTVYEGAGIRLFRTDARRTSAQAYPVGRNGGVIFGRLFEGHCDIQIPRTVAFEADEAHKVIGSSGRHVVERYWGTYVAFVYNAAARRHHIFRDPTGTLACYHTQHRGIDVFFSDLEDAMQCLPGPFHVDPEFLPRWLHMRQLTNDRTGIENIQPLPAGQCVTVCDGVRTWSRLWDAVAIAGNPAFERPEEAARALRSTLQSTVNAWASCYSTITHRLSGGLDSSIVAGCLAQTPGNPRLSFVNIAAELETDDTLVHAPGLSKELFDKFRTIISPGDERRFARLVAQHWHVPLVERKRIATLDHERLTHLPPSLSPQMYFTSFEMDDVKMEMIRTYGTEAFFSGQGGDSVFFAVMQPFAAMDYARMHGLRPSLWRHVIDSARLSRESVWSVIRKTVAHGLLNKRYLSPLHAFERPGLLTDELVAAMTGVEQAHLQAQYAATVSLPPGKQFTAPAVAATPYYDYRFHSGNFADDIDPLDSQPIWELALRIPTYTILLNGTSRGLARYAFRDVLPVEIRKRMTKGTGTPFYQHVVRTHKELLREHLLYGELMKNGYLDRRKVEQCLALDDPSMQVRASTLLSYLSAEFWLQQWRSTGTVPARAPAHRSAGQ